MQKEIIADKDLVATCGLYCGACGKYLSGKCKGCRQNEKLSWCKSRSCCMEKGFSTCADCDKNVKDCKTYTNFMSKLMSIVFRSDRPACVEFIRQNGLEAFAAEMAKRGTLTIKKK